MTLEFKNQVNLHRLFQELTHGSHYRAVSSYLFDCLI